MKQRVPTLEDFVNEQSKATYDYGCLMVNVDNTGCDEFISNLIDKDDLYVEGNDYGLETEPHVTVLYGFHENEKESVDMEKLKKYLIPLNELKIASNEISTFENEKYDVLKYDIKSDKLFELNKTMTENFEYSTDFPNYHPHMTIAYLKPGKGKKYAEKLNNDKSFQSKEYTFSHPDGSKDFIKK